VSGSGASAAAHPVWSGGVTADPPVRRADPARSAEPAGGALMSIGEVLAQLRPEFPDTTISKLRFLETEGLIEPQRTPAGYRKYSWGDVARLRFILSAQRDQYLPLRVIREQLAALDRGEAEAARPRPLVSVVTPAAPAEPAAEVRLGRDEVAARAGVTSALLATLEQYGLVRADAGGWFGPEAVEVAAVAGRLAEYGLEPRHLRAYRAAADREAGLFGQLVAPLVRQSDPSARARAAETIRELSGLTGRLHAALVRAGLRETLGR
jgi:DNA-binding transcriptional MerR regulator